MSSNQARPAGTEYGLHRSQSEPSIPDAELLDLLGDEYTREVLEAVIDQPRSGRGVAEATSVSKPTAFRRLNELDEAGLVTTEMCLDGDGHHHKEYRAVVTDIAIELDGEGLSVTVETEQSRASEAARRPVPADD